MLFSADADFAAVSVILVVFIVMVAFTGALIAALTLANRYLHQHVWLVLLGFMVAFTIVIVSYAGQIDRIFKGIRGIENGGFETAFLRRTLDLKA